MRAAQRWEIPQAPMWANFIVTAFLEAERFDQELEGKVTPIFSRPEVVNHPVHYFLSSVTRGKVEGSRRRCEHLADEAAILVRTSHFWLMGCQPCVRRVLAEGSQDTRCDWCGKARPDQTPTVTFNLPMLDVVAQFCATCMQRLEVR